MKKLVSLFFAVLFSLAALAGENRVAVVISKTSYNTRPSEVMPAAKSWTAACNLAGLPYSTLFVEDLDENTVKDFNVVVFSQCNYLTQPEYDKVMSFLNSIKGKEYGVVVDGPLGLFDQAEDERQSSPINNLLGIVSNGVQEMEGYRLCVADNDHYITDAYKANAYLSNLLSDQLPILTLGEGSEVLVNVSDDIHSYPYETVREKDGLKLAVIGGVSNSACVGASFKNYAPKGFFPTELYPILRKTLQWAVTGDTAEPFPSLLLNGGGMTALIRVDGDGSQAQASMDMCMTYLEDIALETGVQGVMTYVSAWATRAGWHFYVDHSKRLQELGTSIGTHSKNHRLAELQTPEQFSYELDGSKNEIRDNHVSRGYDPGEIRYLVNPGNTLAFNHYDEVASRFDFFMTHGSDQSLPVEFGNLTWFTGGKQLAMVNDSPSPDYQWFYDSSWSHTTAEVANYQNLVLEHMFNNIGNGVVFDAMWHDYSMSKMLVGEPRNVTRIMREGTRIINDNNQEYYETTRRFWNTHDIYCPEVPEFVGKLKLLSNAAFSWNNNGDVLEAEIVFNADDFANYSQFVGGMAVGVNNTDGRAITAVEINGKPWFAFSDEKVILPKVENAAVKLAIHFDTAKPESRVIYTSKILDNVTVSGDAVTATLTSKSMGRVKFQSEKPSIVLGASSFTTEKKGRIVEGRLLGSGNVTLVPNTTNVTIHSATLPVKAVKVSGNSVKVTVSGNGLHHNQIVVSSKELGQRKTIDIDELKGDKVITLK
ncbi:MAG: hypothetical protein MJY41_01295 [Bacteroidales bacterium]|nr:hypothetical protein [Bacteroidales bacterium]